MCSSDLIGAGASGAVLGMYGMMLMFSVVARKLFQPGELSGFFLWAAIVIIYNLIFGLKDGVDNSAHIGGILYGMFAALIFYPSYRKKESFSVTVINDLALVVISLGIFGFTYQQIPKGLAYYDETMQLFDSNQEKALLVLHQLDNDSLYLEKKDYYIQRLKDESVKSWERNIDALSRLNHLPENYNTRVETQQLKQSRIRVIIRDQ